MNYHSNDTKCFHFLFLIFFVKPEHNNANNSLAVFDMLFYLYYHENESSVSCVSHPEVFKDAVWLDAVLLGG